MNPILRAGLVAALLGAAIAAISYRAGAETPVVLPERQADALVYPCDAPDTACMARAIADFDGDGVDDLLFEPILSVRGRTSGLNPTIVPRDLRLVLGPLPRRDGSEPAVASTIAIDVPRFVADLSTFDVDGDGRTDLVLSGTSRVGSTEIWRVAVILGREAWPERIELGKLSRADLVIERQVPAALARSDQHQLVSAAFADVDGDGRADLILANDPPPDAMGRSIPLSEVSIMLAPERWNARTDFRADTVVRGVGRCSDVLGGAADVTGDDVADIVLRRCPGGGLPSTPLLVAGRTSWPEEIVVPNAVSPDVEPPGTPRPPSRGGRGYLIPTGSRPNFGVADPGPIVLLEDIDGDGVRDVAFEHGRQIHLFGGGPDAGDRLASGRSDGVIDGVELGGVALTRAWGLARGANARLEIPLGRLGGISSNLHGDLPPLNLPIFGGVVTLHPFGPDSSRVLDGRADGRATLFLVGPGVLWGSGDLNGDGRTDLLLGHAPSPGRVAFRVVLGPIASGPWVVSEPGDR